MAVLKTASPFGLLPLLTAGVLLGLQLLPAFSGSRPPAEAGSALLGQPQPAPPGEETEQTPPEVRSESVRAECDAMRQSGYGSPEGQAWYEANCLGEALPSPAPALEVPAGEGVLAVGDSVMLGAAAQLAALLPGAQVDAVVSRSVLGVTEALARGLAASPETRAVVVHTGNNGPIAPAELDRILALAGPYRRVLLLNVSGPTWWEAGNNRVIAAAADSHANVELLDWHTTASARTELLWGDGIHLRPEGARVYALLVADSLVGGAADAANRDARDMQTLRDGG